MVVFKVFLVILFVLILIIAISISKDLSRGSDFTCIDKYFTRGQFLSGLYNTFVVDTFSSKTSQTPFIDKQFFPGHKILEENWEIIRDEALNLYTQGKATKIQGDQFFSEYIADQNWYKFYIKWYGNVDPKALEYCPKTVQILQQDPQIHLAMFSILKPGTIIKPHRGPFRGAMRYHLGLSTPGPKCQILVDLESYSWSDGEGVLFDDTFVHSVRNDEENPRIILFLDIERPLRGIGSKINKWVCENIINKFTGRANPQKL